MNAKTQDRAQTTSELKPSRFENGKALTIAGPKGRFTGETRGGITELWAHLSSHLGHLPAQVGKIAYGVCFCPGEAAFDYLAGIEVSTTVGLPPDFEVMGIPAQRYAIFEHRGHVSTLYETMDAIHRQGQPQAATEWVEPAPGAPHFFERYGEKFDPKKGVGDIEVWVPVRSKIE